MWSDWRDHDGMGDDWDVEPPWSPEMSFGDPDAWRGERHTGSDESWRGGGRDAPGESEPWPEWDAGPEYLMWKRRVDEEE